MNLQKAIEIGTSFTAEPNKEVAPQLIDAIKLLIEAGEREIRNRKDPNYVLVGLLPGETED